MEIENGRPALSRKVPWYKNKSLWKRAFVTVVSVIIALLGKDKLIGLWYIRNGDAVHGNKTESTINMASAQQDARDSSGNVQIANGQNINQTINQNNLRAIRTDYTVSTTQDGDSYFMSLTFRQTGVIWNQSTPFKLEFKLKGPFIKGYLPKGYFPNSGDDWRGFTVSDAEWEKNEPLAFIMKDAPTDPITFIIKSKMLIDIEDLCVSPAFDVQKRIYAPEKWWCNKPDMKPWHSVAFLEF